MPPFFICVNKDLLKKVCCNCFEFYIKRGICFEIDKKWTFFVFCALK